jgi:CheY-like chemotaxis protein
LEPARRLIGFTEKIEAARMRRKRDEPPMVLVVEDEPAVRDYAEAIIADELGYRTLAAATAREAIILLEEREIIDVMFTDITLPDGPAAMDGLELARRAVELHPHLRVIYTTGGGQIDSLSMEFVEDGTFLPKPYTAKQLMRALGDHAILAPGI